MSQLQLRQVEWKGASNVLCDHKIRLRLKSKFYKTVVKPAMMYKLECWVVSKQYIKRISFAEMRMLRWMFDTIRKD